MAIKDIFRWLGLALLVFLIAAEIISVSIVAQTLFSGDLGRVIVGIMLFAYVLFFSFTSSLMSAWVSFWNLPKWVDILLVILIFCGFLASLILVPLIVNAGWKGIFLAVPIVLYVGSVYRLVRNLL